MKVIVALVFLSAVIATGYSSRSNNRFDDNRPIESYRLLDALEYTCTDILPLLDHLNYVNRFFGNTKKLVQPVCKYILQEADDFDPTKFCTFVTEYIRTLALLDPGRRRVGSNSGQRRDDYDLVFKLVANATKNLYGIDPNNATTICPNANKLFEPTLGTLYEDILTEYYTDLLTEAIPVLESLCHGRKSFYTVIGVQVDSPYEQLADSLLDIGSETAGYDDYADFCDGTKQWFSQGYAGRRKGANRLVILMRNKFNDALDRY
ncbi:uncharacterized protein LOC121406345 [Lytechinus variegatus]|uniref:uncharacterized protein LOC121406345 n=1 Tax=Lytechinus variegatus TaxID=7654 RepID=UPI001BB1BD24|nr:uncharacterized protein LOC121406345 [Lytechinus variegatus]